MRDKPEREHRELKVELKGVSFGYARETPVLRGVDLRLTSGLVLLLGPNGHGKSTLLKLLAGVEYPDQGRVEIDGKDLWTDEAAARQRLAYVPEQPDITPYASVREVLELVADLRAEPRERVSEVLDLMGLEEGSGLGRRSIRELSKGQRRRVLLAASRLGDPRILLLDEPLDALDRGLRADLLVWLAERQKAGALIVVVTHELEPFVPMATAAVGMVRGSARYFADLPERQEERLRLLEKLARGEDP